MNLGEVRALFIRHSGRYDLVNDDGSDNGANTFINWGQRFLDRMTDISKTNARYSYIVEANTYAVIMPECRAIKEVWCSTEETRNELKIRDMREMRHKYAKPFSQLKTGRPRYFSMATLRMAPESDRLTIANALRQLNQGDVMFGQQYKFNGVILWPPTDNTYMIEAWGMFYNPELINDGDKSWWSEEHTNALIFAACYQLETMHRNTQGANDWLNALQNEIRGIDYDQVEQDQVGITDLDGR